jgi:kynurenine formamidase
VYQAKRGIFTRGVLMDIPQLKGVPWLEPGTAIYPEDLEAWEKKSGSKVQPGDVVLIRTGRWARRAEKGVWKPDQLAGLHVSCVRWLKQRDAAVLGSDAASDVRPSGVDGFAQPVHTLTIVTLGVPILDNCDLEEVSRESLKRKRWSFLLTTSPLAVPGATGSALNPIAVF